MSEKRLCSKCGATLPERANFCPNCGTPSALTAPQPTPIRGEYREEKYEKSEKSEKHEKREKGEKEEKRGDRTGAVIGGLIIIWLGISFYLAQTQPYMMPWASWWTYFLTGLGVIVILNGLIRYVDSGYRYTPTGSLIGGSLLLVVGLMGLIGVRDFWPIILIVIGVIIIVTGITARSRAPRP